MRARAAFLLLLGASGCPGSGAATPTHGATSPAVDEAPPSDTAPGASPTATDAARVQNAPAVSLAGELAEQGGVQLVVQNRAAAPVSLAANVAVERATDAGFAAFADRALSLRFACDAPPTTCIELVPGAELRPPAWLATAGRAQCGERGGATAPPGRYRFIAGTCDGGARIEGAPFELPATP